MFFQHPHRQLIHLIMALASITFSGTLELEQTIFEGCDDIPSLFYLLVGFDVLRLEVLIELLVPIYIHRVRLCCLEIQQSSYRQMQDSISKLIKKFRQHDPYHYSSNKQNCYKRQPRENVDSKDQINFLNRKIQTLENSVDSLVTDANRVIKHFQESIRQHIFNNEQVKEQFANFKLTVSQQKKDSEAQLKELTEKIEDLKSQAMRKQIEFLGLLQKYEDYQQCIAQLRKEDQQNFIQLQEKTRRQTYFFQEKIAHSQFQATQAKNKMLQTIAKVQELQSENDFLKKLVEELIQQNQDLKSKCIQQNAEIQLQKSKSIQSECLFQYDFECLSRQEESQLKPEELKLADSRQMQPNLQKEILNISEHYSKYNQTDEMRSKEQSRYHFVVLNSNQSRFQKMQDQRRKSVKNKQVVSRLFSNGLVRINTGESEKSVPRYQPGKQSNINEVKEFRMVDSQQSPMINPYKAFFQLMTQCQKMNSPNFWQICNLDLSYLYNEFLAEGVPYNVWQGQIRKALRIKQQ